MTTAAETRRLLLQQLQNTLPDPGSGRTAARHRSLIDVARRVPVGVARLVEAHCDAVSILHEAGIRPRPETVYGVWASASPDDPVLTDRVLSGSKRFCSGLGIVDRALVTVSTPSGGELLVDINVRTGPRVAHRVDAWSTPALAETMTGDTTFVQVDVTSDAIVGGDRWYLTRPGFWHGAMGPAACWAGATLGIIDVARDTETDDHHRLAQVGAMEAAAWTLPAIFERAGDQIDAAPKDRDAAEHRARAVRHTTERLCSDVLDRFSRAMGPRPFVECPELSRRFADTHLYLRQHHGERELEALAAVAREVSP